MSDPTHGDPLDSDDDLHPSRRLFVQTLTFMGGGAVLFGCTEEAKKPPGPPAKGKKHKPDHALAPTELPAQKGAHKTFTDAEWAVMVAAVDRILPKDQDPGAVDANVPEYIDRILQSKELQRMRVDFVGGLNALDRRAARGFGNDAGTIGFAQLTEAQKDQLLAEFKDYEGDKGDSKWYEILLVLTMEGFLGDPSYGGNKDYAGWKLVGYNLIPTPAAPPPAGYDGANNLAEHHCHGKGG